jgi:hypothetical protein
MIMRALFVLLLTLSAVAAQTTTNPVRPVQHTNGRVVSPTNFWTANSNALNAVVAGGGSSLPAWVSTNARTSATNLGLGWSGLTNTNAAGLRSALGLSATWLTNTVASNFHKSLYETGDDSLITWERPFTWVFGGDPNSIFSTFIRTVTRQNLDIPWSGLTNTNAAGVRSALSLSAWTTNTTSPLFPSTNASAASAPAWLLNTAPTNGVATIATNQHGVGWDELGRFSVNTPVGSLSMYETGSPSTPVIYWPGTIVANRLSAVFFDSIVYASNIVGGAAGGNIADSVMQASMTRPLTDWQDGSLSAGARGIPYILSNAVTQPETGSYVPWVTTVTNDVGNNLLQGRYTNLAGFRGLIEAELAATNLTVTNAVTIPSARRVIATIDSSLAASSNTITLRTNSVLHGDTVDVRYVRTADSSTVNIVDTISPTTNALMWTRSMFFSYSTNVTPARWVPVGRTIGADVVLGSLATNNSVPSGASVAGVPLTADGAGGSSFGSQREWLARQTTNGPTVTNGTTTSSLVISNVPSGLYWVQGQMNSTASAGRTWTFLAPNQVFGPRNLLGWFEIGSASGFFNTATNLSANADGGTGARNIAISGPMLFTNTATVSFNVTISGATNTAQVLSNSFLFLRKLD